MPHGVEGAQAALTARFPRHEGAFRDYLDRIVAIRRVYSYVGRTKAWPRWRRLAALPVFPLRTLPLLRSGKLSLADELERCFGDDEAAKLAVSAHIGYYGSDAARLWFPFWAVAQGSYHAGGGHYPHGGSRRLVEHLLGVIREAGGDAVPGRQLTQILVDDGRVAGIEHEARDGPDGSRRDRAPVVFGNAAPSALAEALPETERAAFSARYADFTPATSLFTLALGLDRPPRELGVGAWSTVIFPDWMDSLGDFPANVDLMATAPGSRNPYLVVVDYNAVDAGLPRPPYLLTVTGLDRAENWAGDETEYHARREVWSRALLDIVEREFPGIAGSVVERDLTTGRSVAGYLNTPSGAVYGFATEPPRTGRVRPSREATAVPGLFLASAFTHFGGYTGSIMGGALAFGAASRYLRARG
jgi:phytoene dehydrogenase-like protein